jgi:hypothetical protein
MKAITVPLIATLVDVYLQAGWDRPGARFFRSKEVNLSIPFGVFIITVGPDSDCQR